MKNHSPHRRFACAVFAFFGAAAPLAHGAESGHVQQRADRFLSHVNASYQALSYLKSVGVLPADFKTDETAFLLNDALAGGGTPFIFWSAGVMAHWEADIYARNLPASEWNARWWKYVREFQGVESPGERGGEFCDAAGKTHINDAPAYYFNYP